MKVYIGTDHRGVETQNKIVNYLKDLGIDINISKLKHNDNDELDGIRAIRLIDPRGTSGSRCTIADIDIRGWLENDS